MEGGGERDEGMGVEKGGEWGMGNGEKEWVWGFTVMRGCRD